MRWIGFTTLLVFLACGHDDDLPPTLFVTGTPTTIASDGTCTGPGFEACTISLTISTENFTLVPPAPEDGAGLRATHDEDGESIYKHEGHYHVYIDTTEMNPIWQDHDPNPSIQVLTSAGPHQLILRLQGTDHKIVEPEVTATLDITAE